MMLNLAIELAKLVKSENTVTWSNLDAVDAYIARLQSAVDRLSLDNNELHRCHVEISQKVFIVTSNDPQTVDLI